jgi:WD40 repeat protein
MGRELSASGRLQAGTTASRAVHSATFSPDGRTFATSDTDGSTYTWRVR